MMTPEQHDTVAIILGISLTVLLVALIWLRWDDVRRIK